MKTTLDTNKKVIGGDQAAETKQVHETKSKVEGKELHGSDEIQQGVNPTVDSGPSSGRVHADHGGAGVNQTLLAAGFQPLPPRRQDGTLEGMTATDNPIAAIVRGEVPCDKVYEDENFLAFHDVKPMAPTHVVVAPKAAWVSMDDAPEDLVSATFALTQRVARDLGLDQSGYRVIANHGRHSGHKVPYFHVHILGGQRLGPLVTRIANANTAEKWQERLQNDAVNAVDTKPTGIDVRVLEAATPTAAETAAKEIAAAISSGRTERAVIAVDSEAAAQSAAIAANKLGFVRAAICRTSKQAEMTRRHNDANVLIVNRTASRETLGHIASTWEHTGFQGGKHSRRVIKIDSHIDVPEKVGKKTIPIASDHGGYELKRAVIDLLESQGYEVADLGPAEKQPCDYPDYGHKVASLVSSGRCERGINICTTGIGMSMVSNRAPEVRAVLCNDADQVDESRELDPNLLVLGQAYTSVDQLDEILARFLAG